MFDYYSTYWFICKAYTEVAPPPYMLISTQQFILNIRVLLERVDCVFE